MTTVRTRKPSTAAWANIASSIVYQPLSGLVKSFTHGNGLTTTNTHSLDYELARCQVKDGTLSLIDKSYTRADKLNITSITDAVTAGNSQSLWYNKSNRLQNANGPWGQKTFYYDGTGNRTYEITTPPGSTLSATDTVGYPTASNRISNVVSGTTTTRTFTHDPSGWPASAGRRQHHDRRAQRLHLRLRLRLYLRAAAQRASAAARRAPAAQDHQPGRHAPRRSPTPRPRT